MGAGTALYFRPHAVAVCSTFFCIPGIEQAVAVEGPVQEENKYCGGIGEGGGGQVLK